MAAVLIVGRGLAEAGVVDLLASWLVRVPTDSPAAGRTVRDLVEEVGGEVLVLGIVRRDNWLAVVTTQEAVEQGDLLVVEADRKGLEGLIERHGLDS